MNEKHTNRLAPKMETDPDTGEVFCRVGTKRMSFEIVNGLLVVRKQSDNHEHALKLQEWAPDEWALS